MSKQAAYWINYEGDLQMSSEKNRAINKAKALIELLKTNGINIYEAYVFGSAIKDMADEYSDIDIAIVSKDFSGIPYYDVKKVSKYRRAIDLRLEIHPFSLKDINVDPPLFFMNIKDKGVRIH
jgi:predicted nucleotidyltransferase